MFTFILIVAFIALLSYLVAAVDKTRHYKELSKKLEGLVKKQELKLDEIKIKFLNVRDNYIGNLNKVRVRNSDLQARLNKVSSERDQYRRDYYTMNETIAKLSDVNVSLEASIKSRDNLINYYRNKYENGSV